MRLLLGPVLATLLLSAVATRSGIRFAGILVLLTTCVAPLTLIGGDGGFHVGISGPSLELRAAAAGVLLTLVAGARPLANLGPFFPFAVFAVVASTFSWTMSGQVQSGLVHLAVAAAAWGAGRAVGTSLIARGGNPMWFVLTLCFVALTQAVVALCQAFGIFEPITDDRTAELTATGRVTGTLGHPNTLAKVMFLVIVLSLPWAARRGPVGRLAICAIGAAIVPAVMSGGRAGVLAIVLLLGLWGLSRFGGQGVNRRVYTAGGAVLTAAVFYAIFQNRVLFYRVGGYRDRLLGVALEILPEHPFSGVGPNNYVTAVGPGDALTALGWPVHNTFVLAAVELGILGAATYFLPLILAIGTALRRRRRNDLSGRSATALLCALPGMAVICMTGWGMLAGEVLLLWFFTCGLLVSPDVEGAPGGAPLQAEEPRGRTGVYTPPPPSRAYSRRSMARN